MAFNGYRSFYPKLFRLYGNAYEYNSPQKYRVNEPCSRLTPVKRSVQSNDILEVWKQCPNKHTLGFYGIGSDISKPDAVLFNRLITKCLNKAKGFKKEVPKKTTPVETKPYPKYTLKLPVDPCNRLVLNCPMLAAKVKTLPTVQRNLSSSFFHCSGRKQKELPWMDDISKNKGKLKDVLDVEKSKSKQKSSSRRKSKKSGQKFNVSEFSQYGQDPAPYKNNFKIEQEFSKPKNYDELYVDLIKCFENNCLDPICVTYHKCCTEKGEKGTGREEKDGDKSKMERMWNNRVKVGRKPKKYEREEREGKDKYDGEEGDEEVGVKSHRLPEGDGWKHEKKLQNQVGIRDKEKQKEIEIETHSFKGGVEGANVVPHKSSLKRTPSSLKPSKSGDNYGSGDRSTTNILKEKKQVKIGKITGKPDGEKHIKEKNKKQSKNIKNEKHEAKEKTTENKILSKTKDWQKHFKRSHEPLHIESNKPSLDQYKTVISLEEHDAPNTFSGNNDNSIIPLEKVDKSIVPTEKIDLSTFPLGENEIPIIPSGKNAGSTHSLRKNEIINEKTRKHYTSIVHSKKHYHTIVPSRKKYTYYKKDKSIHPTGIDDSSIVPSGRTDLSTVRNNNLQNDEIENRKGQSMIERGNQLQEYVSELRSPRVKKKSKIMECECNMNPNIKKSNKFKNKTSEETPSKRPMKCCPCAICVSLKRESDTVLIRNLKAEEKRRQLRDYFKCLRYFDNISFGAMYRAPLHKCDPINCDNSFYCNMRLYENCDYHSLCNRMP